MASNRLATIDIFVILLYLVISFVIALSLSKRARKNTQEYFISGRALPWWLLGTSMVATTFAADTPLVVSGLVAKGGIWQNWLWWQWGIGGMVAVFLFAGLWHRAGITTDAEFIELRYDGKPAAALRFYKVLWFGILQNILIIAWVMKAMVKIVMVVMGWSDDQTVLGMQAESLVVLALFAVTVVYTTISGLWGVVLTDFFQFALAMGGSVVTAILALHAAGGWNGVSGKIAEAGFSAGETFRMIPAPSSLFEASPFTEFLILVLVVWWASYTIDGGGYLAQRLFAAKNERHSILGFLWYSIAHVALRPWPWIVVGLSGMALFGRIEDPERLYPMVMSTVLAPGIFGMVLASFFAAFMSTESTQLNWGSSLVVNDLLRRFAWKGKTERQYVVAGEISVISLAALGALASFAVKDISFAWKLVISVTAGVGTVYAARWYWWRVNAWSEIAAMGSALLSTLVLGALASSERFGESTFVRFPYSTALTVGITTPIWIVATLATKPVSRDRLARFYERCHPGGLGWRKFLGSSSGSFARRTGLRTFSKILCGTVALYMVLFGIGSIVLGTTITGSLLLALGAIALAVLFSLVSRR